MSKPINQRQFELLIIVSKVLLSGSMCSIQFNYEMGQ